MSEKHQLELESASSKEHRYESHKIEEFEKGSSAPSYISHSHLNTDDVESLQHGTKRGLDARHIQMISLGGAIG